ncbi:MAG TPA: hypothetical protein VGQ99_11145 [Tepidisphaeraceae bacterium]|jgi:hypothetical protein|nr:hypothetical protein [Tepidisphaeraceae bacterium]
MNHDDPNFTAYVLGEVDGPLDLDSAGMKMVEETALIARILTNHLAQPRCRLRIFPSALAASLLIAAATLSILFSRSSHHQTTALIPTEPAAAHVAIESAPILHLTPTLANTAPASSLTSTTFKGIPAMDVEQLVTAVLHDAQRVGSFTSFHLTPEFPVAFQ